MGGGRAGPDEHVSPLKYMAELYMQRYGVYEDELHASLQKLCHGQSEYYVKSRSLTWWLDFCMNPVYDPVWWHKCFRMSKESFETLVELLTPFLERESTNWKLTEMIEPSRMVAIFLYRVAHGTDYFTLSEKFAVGCSTITRIMEVRPKEPTALVCQATNCSSVRTHAKKERALVW